MLSNTILHVYGIRVLGIYKMDDNTIITLQIADTTVNIIKNTFQNSKERDFELLVDYVEAVKDIYDCLNFKQGVKN